MKIIRVFCGWQKFKSVDEIDYVKHIDFIKKYGSSVGEIYGKTYRFTIDDDYTHAIILNGYESTKIAPELTIPKENVIAMSHEPIEFLKLTPNYIKYIKKHVGKYFIGSNAETFGDPFINYYSYMWHMKPTDTISRKPHLISLMVSQKHSLPGHKYRHQLVQRILKTDLPIHIYGRGCPYYMNYNDERIRGIFKSSEPYETYTFHICIENIIKEYWFTEKIINPLLYTTTPVYLGCKKIDEFFPNNVVKLTGNINRDMKLLADLCKQPDKYIKNIDYKEVFNKVSFENILTHFK